MKLSPTSSDKAISRKMPNANLAKQLPLQARWDAPLLRLPPIRDRLSVIRTEIKLHKGIPVGTLANLLDIPRPTITHHLRRSTFGNFSPIHDGLLPEHLARAVVQACLPRLLGWKSTRQLGKEIGLHRNSVVSFVKMFGKRKMLRYSLDQKLYISPEGEKLVRQRKSHLDNLKNHETLQSFARQLKLRPNIITAFLSARNIRVETNRHGRALLSDAQKAMIVEWRGRILERREKKDLVVEGKVFRSAHRVAAEYASLYAREGSKRHKHLTHMFESSLDHFALRGNYARRTAKGLYIPRESADMFLNSINLIRASRLFKISHHTIKKWANADPTTWFVSYPGKTKTMIALIPLLERAHKAYLQGAHLGKRREVPTILLSTKVASLARSLGTGFSQVARLLPISREDLKSLSHRVGMLPRPTYLQVSALFSDKGAPNQTITLSSQTWTTAQQNAVQLGLTPKELTHLAISRAFAERLDPQRFSLEVPKNGYMNLVRLGSVHQSMFSDLKIIPACNLRDYVVEWGRSALVSLDLACSLAKVSASEREQIRAGNGFITGRTALSLVQITRQSAAKMAVVGENPLKSQLMALKKLREPRDLPPPKDLQKKFTGRVVHQKEELREILVSAQTNAIETPIDLDDVRLSSALMHNLIEITASSRKVSPQKVFLFLKDFFRGTNRWPETYDELWASAIVKDDKFLFRTDVGLFLNAIEDPSVHIHVHGKSSRTPRVGDLLAHPYLGDFGPISAIENTEGGRVAKVCLNSHKETLAFRVP